jgi:hypothetical protein
VDLPKPSQEEHEGAGESDDRVSLRDCQERSGQPRSAEQHFGQHFAPAQVKKIPPFDSLEAGVMNVRGDCHTLGLVVRVLGRVV